MSTSFEEMLNAKPTLEDFQHWTQQIGRAQQLLMEFALSPQGQDVGRTMVQQMMDPGAWGRLFTQPMTPPAMATPQFGADWMTSATSFWQDNLNIWQKMMSGETMSAMTATAAASDKDRRFKASEWHDHPLFAFIRQSYAVIAEHLLQTPDALEGVDEKTRAQIRFATSNVVDAFSPSNFALTNPQVLKRTLETRGENLVKGLEHMLKDLSKGQLTHVDASKFELGVNIAATPGKVVYETPLFQLIHYTPTTDSVIETPLVIFPPWINRFYILDLNPEKSFIRWAVEQGVSTFVVSWKSADASMKDVVWDDYISAQIDAIATVKNLLGVEGVHTIGYCVAGTTLAATLAVLQAQGVPDAVKSATFFTAQIDFSEAGDLLLMVDEKQLALIDQLSSDGFLDGRYMAATFNSLRGRDLIWNYVVNNYLLGEDYPPFDLLYWNGDTTNLPAKWHQSYLKDLYRDNKLVEPGAMVAEGTPLDLRTIKTPIYIQAGREDHIAPANSVWKMMDHVSGPKRFVLAGSGHIAGVVNPPSAQKYQYWRNDDSKVKGFDDFVAGAKETKGSWWPDWIEWLTALDDKRVPAKGPRFPGKGSLRAIEDAPGRYVKAR